MRFVRLLCHRRSIRSGHDGKKKKRREPLCVKTKEGKEKMEAKPQEVRKREEEKAERVVSGY